MADYPTMPQPASTPNPAPHTSAHASPDPHRIVQLLLALTNVSRAELPDGPDRDILMQLIRWGMVLDIYRPMGHDTHVIEWANRPPWADPRERISDWLAARRHWEATGKLAPERERLSDEW